LFRKPGCDGLGDIGHAIAEMLVKDGLTTGGDSGNLGRRGYFCPYLGCGPIHFGR
ncbi:MAG: hypothetical protein GXX91_05340, partial [Verrucomicrobiaceae bacterium]|nr:hypothetical protein [Verrucomicrobiaceae bacterium]